ncbi:MAG: AAA family ATPase [Synergistaceae bacterium]|nr:AAA family ATPase [Synergistaceae bacterium]
MQINKIRLVNFRGMEDLTVEFSPGVNVIIGDNGAGKSSLLSGICVALGGLLGNLYIQDINASQQIEDEDIRMTSVLVGDTTENTEKHFPVTVEVDLMLFNGQQRYEVAKENMLSPSIMRVPYLQNNMREAISNPAIKLPLLNYQSAEKKFVPKTQSADVIKLRNPERKEGYKNAFSGTSDFPEILDWCTQMDYSEYRLKHEVREYRNFKSIISKFMKELINLKTAPRVDYAAAIGQLMFYNGSNGEAINILSVGYQNVLCMMMDLARRTVLLNPTMDELETLEGVVIIDEIDMHLHPKWQWKILDALKATFPKVQFIVATHSPMIISSAKDAKLIKMINPNEIEYLTSAYGYNISDVVELRQGSTELPRQAKELKNALENSIDDGNFEKAEQLVREAVEIFGENSSPAREMRDFLDVNRWIEEAE